MTNGRVSLWSRATSMAEQTPPERNRYVDFLRAFSIVCVVFGHWLVAAPFVADGQLQGTHLLGVLPWTQWLTWFFQVMPLFFFVGGYSNGVSWALNRERDGTYASWLVGRIQRLINPVIPLYLVWIAFAGFASGFNVSADMVSLISQLALVPIWFLAVYLVVVALVPLTWGLWERWGLGSFLIFLACAAAVDIAAFVFHLEAIRFLNFAFVWLGVHQLGYAWQAGQLQNRTMTVALAIVGGLALVALVRYGVYPIAMIGVPGTEVSNSMPPTMALFALGLTQAGIVLSLEPLGRAWLTNTKTWAAVILLSGMIMTVYLWHLTAFVLATAIGYGIGVGLYFEPGSGAWWLARLIWIPLFLVALAPFIAIFTRFEQEGLPIPDHLPMWRLVSAIILVCGGLALTAAQGIGSEGWTGVKLWLVALPFIGAALVDFGPLARGSTSK